MTQEEFFYQCVDIIEHWLNHRKISDLREVSDKLYNEVTKPHWISVEDELPPCNVFVLTCDGQENENLLMLGGNGRWYDKAVGFHRNITHWMPLPEAPHHIIDANKKVDRVIGTADHIKTALDVLNKKGGENDTEE